MESQRSRSSRTASARTRSSKLLVRRNRRCRRSTRPGGHVAYVGVAHAVELPGEELFFSHVHLHGGPAPVRRFLPELVELIWKRQIDPGKVFDLDLPLDEAAAGYRAMDQRQAIKVLLHP